jgi:YdjC-like protein/Glycosyl transferase family 2
MLVNSDNLREQHDGHNSKMPDGCASPMVEDVGQDANIILNADDWGWNLEATNRILDCVRRDAVSSVSAMVFMEASERAAWMARENNVDAGLHLNFTTPFTGRAIPLQLVEHQRNIARFLRSHRYAPVMFHPGLVNSFEYVVRRQIEEFGLIYGTAPSRLDGHHHMHLCTNVLLQRLLPQGAIVRRNFSFAPGEKRRVNRWFRRAEDNLLARRHPITDYFFDLLPTGHERMAGIAALARCHNVEIETHPARADEHRFLTSGGLAKLVPDLKIARGYLLRGSTRTESHHVSSAPLPVIEVSTGSESEKKSVPHICVCICTYKRAEPLKRLLRDLDQQETGGLFTFSIVVADNDPEGSAKSTVEAVAAMLSVRVKYCAEPRRGIARARNAVVANAEGDYLALIDDDEFPISEWLKILLTTCRRYNVDGILGPVKRHFDEEPPSWLKKSSLYDRSVNPTGMQVEWKESRTGNVLLKREIVLNDPMPFRPEFRAGEDQDFFRRKIEEGRRFVWCAEAAVYEVIPPSRWTRLYYIRKALLQGSNAAKLPDCGPRKLLKSLIAVPLYTLILPLALLAGQSCFMTLLVKLCDHTGKLLQVMKINPIREEYVSE